MRRPDLAWAIGPMQKMDRTQLDDGQPLHAGDVFIERPDGRGYRRAAPHEIPPHIRTIQEQARAGAFDQELPDAD